MEQPKRNAFLYKYTTVQGWLMFGLSCICAVIFVSSWLFWMIGHQAAAGMLLRIGVRENEAVVSYRDVTPPGALSDVAVNDEGVFLLYETSAVVRAYSHDRAYLYSLMFSNPRGRSGVLYAGEDELYYHQVSGSGLYHVQGGVTRARYRASDESFRAILTQLQMTEPRKQKGSCWYNGSQYCIDGQDVLRIGSDDTTEKLIDGPEFLGMLEHPVLWPFMAIFMVLTPGCWMASLRVERKYAKKNR